MTANSATVEQRRKAYDLEQLEKAARDKLREYEATLPRSKGGFPIARGAAKIQHKVLQDAVRVCMQNLVAYGYCPCCGRKLRCNNSMGNWWQCQQFGAPQFRADANLPSCDYQISWS